jgi:hypothetical protein
LLPGEFGRKEITSFSTIVPPSLATWVVSFKAEVLEHLIRIKGEFHQDIVSWLETL